MHVPTELVDTIIDEVFASTGTVDGPTPSALALVSHTFRQRTNFHRFAKISFMRRIEPLSSVHEFLALLNSVIWTPHAGVARHIREFSLALGVVEEHTVVDNRYGPQQHTRLGPHPSFTDGSMAEILSMIFRHSTPGSEPIDNTLVLNTYANSGYPALFDINQRNSWDDLVNPQFGSALQGLLDTYVSKLVLLRINDLPLTLLTASHIRQLTLRKARFKLPSTSDQPILGQMVHLQDLGIDGASEFPAVFDHLSPTLAFPAVKHLRYYIDTNVAFWTSIYPWKHLGALEILTLDVSAKPSQSDLMQTINTTNPLSGNIRQLKKLIITVDMSSYNRLARLSGLTSDFVLGNIFVGLLPHLPLTNDLDLSFRSEDFTPTARSSFATTFEHFHFTLVDQVIHSLQAAYGKFPSALTPPTITLRFNVYIASALEDFDVQEFCKAGHLFLQQSFPSVNNGPGHTNFENRVSKLSPKDGKHHYDITLSLVCSH